MKKNAIFLVTLFAFILTGANTSFAQEEKTTAPVIDMKLFFKNGEKNNFQISPDGKYYSYLANYKDMLNVFVQRIGEKDAIRITNDTLRSIWYYTWKGGRIIYAQDTGGDENFQLYSVTAAGDDLKALTPFPGSNTYVQDDFSFIPGKEKEMLIMLNKRDKQYFDPYIVNIETGGLRLLFENNQSIYSFVTDNNGVIRILVKSDGANSTYLYRETEKDTFHLLFTVSFKETFYPRFFDAGNKNIYTLSDLGRDKVALVEYDPAAGKEVKEIFAHPDYDLEDVNFNRKTKTIVDTWWKGEKNDGYFIDKERGKIISSLKEQFPGYNIYFSSYDNDMKSGILNVTSDRLRHKYYLYNFVSGTLQEIGNAFPWLDEKNMAEMKPIAYKSRDGLTIHGYLTLPNGSEGKNLPVVINPHGGPWYRDEWGFNPEIQFLVNRGYAVLQMNFRGSTGYGRKFWVASIKQWGKKMQDDITDGVAYLIKEGIADPKRIAIYGGSYGGYATLAGITFTPDLYTCAVDYCGVSNLFTFLKTIPPYWKPYLEMYHEIVGDPEKDSLLLLETSPVFHADKIKAPLFIAQGANDPRVNKDESDQMVAALKKRGIDVEYMVKDNEGHGFANQQNRFDFYSAMEKFLEKHMKINTP